jgi:hypothetical protein
MASNKSCFMITWTTFKHHFLEVRLTQNRETMALRTLTQLLIYSIYHVWGPTCIEIHWINIWLRAWSHMTTHYTWGSVTTLHDFGRVLGRPLDTFFWALTIWWSRLLGWMWSTHVIESPLPLHFKHSHWWKRRGRSKFASHRAWGTNGVRMWMQDGCNVYMDIYMASNGSCFMVTWTIFKNNFLEVGLTQIHGTMVLQTLTTIGLFILICVRNNLHE